MTESGDDAGSAQERDARPGGVAGDEQTAAEGLPSNPVYARVGDVVLQAVQDGVRRGLPPEEIVREVVLQHNVRLTVGEMRLLLASRRIPA